MRILFTGDWQCSVANLDRCRIVVNQIIEILNEKGSPSYVVHLGDVKSAFNPVDQRVTNFLIESISRIKANCEGFFFLRGNHDNITTQDGVPSCSPLLEVSGADVVADGRWKLVKLGRIGLWMVPYFRDPVRQKKMFANAYRDARSAKWAKIRILAFHNEIAGCERTAYAKGTGLSADEIGSPIYNLCKGGHIHRPQRIGNVYFAGSPFCEDWGEANEQKSFLVVTVPEKNLAIKVSRVPSRVPGWYDPEIPGFKAPKTWKDCRVRITVPIEKDPLREMNAARATFEKRYVGAILNLVPDFQKSASPEGLDVDVTAGDEQLLRKYLDKIVLPEDVTVDQVANYLRKYLPDFGRFGVQGLKFLNIHATETLCFKECQLNLDRKGLTLVTGKNLDWSENVSNGAGKSSLVALPFIALFGKTFKGQQHDGWARQDSKLPAVVRLLIQLPEGRALAIVRGRRPSLLRVYLDGKEITMGDVNATQAMIERMTNLTWDVLTNAVYIGQREIGSVFGTEKERKELFSRLLGLDRFLEAETKLRKIVLRRQRSVESVELEIASAEAALAEARNGIADVEAALAEAPVIDPKMVATREKTISDLEVTVRTREQENDALKQLLEENQKEFEGFLSKASDAEATARTYQERIDAIITVKERCPLCGSKVTPTMIDVYVKELTIKARDAEVSREKFEKLQRKNRAERRALMEKFQKNTVENRNVQQKLNVLRQEVARFKEQVDARARLEEILRQKNERSNHLLRMKSIHERARIACLEEKRFAEICVQAVGRDGLPAYLCATVVPQLNAAAAKYSQVFSEGEIGIRFSAASGSIDVEICNLHGGQGIKDQSMGEMRMAGLITAFAFRSVLVPYSILILDEPAEGLDATNATAFARGLRSIVEQLGSVFVISHNERILSELDPDYKIEIVKKDGIATVRPV